MVANINNFGVVNFYENNNSKQEPKQKAEPVCEDIEPVHEQQKAAVTVHIDHLDTLNLGDKVEHKYN